MLEFLLTNDRIAPEPGVPQKSDTSIQSRSRGFSSSSETIVYSTLGAGLAEGMPAQMSLAGVAAQMDGIERYGDDSVQTFRAVAPIPQTITGQGTEWDETIAGVADARSGVYLGPDLTGYRFAIQTASRGVYSGTISDATNTSVLMGPGNERGHQGADYYRITRYEVPLTSEEGHSGRHSQCATAIVYMHQRVDFDGFKVTWHLQNSALSPDFTTGNEVQNPGYIIYNALAHPLNTSEFDYDRADLDTWSDAAEGGAWSANLAADRYVDANKKHVSAPGTSPAWSSVFYNNSTHSTTQARGWLEGDGMAIAWTGRGFYPGSPFGFGPNRQRHEDPRLRGTSLEALNAQGVARADQIRNTLMVDGNNWGGASTLIPNRHGTFMGATSLFPNESGGDEIDGHGMYAPTSSVINFLSYLCIAESRRFNHTFGLVGSDRHIVPGDSVSLQASPGEVPALTTQYNTKEAILSPYASYQFNMVGPSGPTDPNAAGYVVSATHDIPVSGDRNPGGGQAISGVAGTPRDWNRLQGAETMEIYEDPIAIREAVSDAGYTHNVAHSARMLQLREAWLFGMDTIGYELMTSFGAFCQAQYNNYDVLGQDNWNFTRADNNLFAWGVFDHGITLDGQAVKGQGQIVARRRRTDQVAPFLGDKAFVSSAFTTRAGPKIAGYVTNRVFAWNLVMQMGMFSMGTDSMRAPYLDMAPAADGFTHNPLLLVAGLYDEYSDPYGFTSTFGKNGGGGSKQYVDTAAGGQTNLDEKTGGIPYNGSIVGQSSLDAADDPGHWWGTTLDFHEHYTVMGLDSAASVLQDLGRTAEVEMLKPGLLHMYWIDVTHAANSFQPWGDQGPNKRIGIHTYPGRPGPNGPGFIGQVNDVTTVLMPNPPVTEQQWRAGAGAWLGNPFPAPVGQAQDAYGREIEDKSLGRLIAAKWATPDQREEIREYYRRYLDLPGNGSIADAVSILRSSGFGFSPGGLAARGYPFCAEIERYLA